MRYGVGVERVSVIRVSSGGSTGNLLSLCRYTGFLVP